MVCEVADPDLIRSDQNFFRSDPDLIRSGPDLIRSDSNPSSEWLDPDWGQLYLHPWVWVNSSRNPGFGSTLHATLGLGQLYPQPWVWVNSTRTLGLGFF